MEVPGGHKNKALVCLYEALGTAILLIAINWIGGNNPVAISITFFAAIVILGNVSGAHFNPAVTIAVLIKNGNFMADLPFALMIICSQITGGFLGVLTVFASLSTVDMGGYTVKEGTLERLCPAAAVGNDVICDPTNFVFKIFLTEFVCTSLFVSLILTVKFHTQSNEGILGAATVAATLCGMINLADAISSACLNPAVGFVQSIFQPFAWDATRPHYEDESLNTSYNISYGSLWIYVLAPTMGGVFAGLFQLFNGLVHNKMRSSTPNTTYNKF
jgi:glycerol uptake facilitator-like aquaporin